MTTELSAETVHASAVAIEGRAVLIEGRSGVGKSDLALRLIDRGAQLISDDYTLVQRRGRQLVASPPEPIAGKIEVRGVGIVPLPFVRDVPVAMIVRVDDHPDRLPDEIEQRRLAGIAIRVMPLPALEPSSPIKVEMALRLIDPDAA
ncbi:MULTISPECIES: HPr kinase/phosphorylase [unclassified Sphingomonas]|uniref:HPr kinase/phosphorylase n=1 Tax=unclassified Sphingomonas TaxID=196159 RepID=UPI00082FDEC9|nr:MULTISPECIES: HPr kinase/phosphatase C-terminal domain-containing protein [unclassified Sphingomonas]